MVFEQGLEKNTKRVLSSILATIPKRMLISEHLGLEMSPARQLFVENANSISLTAKIAPYHRRGLFQEQDMRVSNVQLSSFFDTKQNLMLGS